MVAETPTGTPPIDLDTTSQDVTSRPGIRLTNVTPDKVFPSRDDTLALDAFVSQRVRCPMTVEATHKLVAGAVAAILDGRMRRDPYGQWWAWTGDGWADITDAKARAIVSGLIGRRDTESAVRRAVVPFKLQKLTADQKADLVASSIARWDGKALKDAATGELLSAVPVAADEWAESSDTVSKVTSAIAGRASVLMDAEFDGDPYVINASGTLIDLSRERFMQCRPLTRHDLVSRSLGAALDTHAQCPQWRTFIAQVCAEIVDGTPTVRPDVERFLQVAMGLQLIGEQREQLILVLFGTMGSNGKSVLINTLAMVFGGYATTLPQSVVTETRYEGHTTDLMPLKGARFVYLSETPRARWDAETLKRLTSTERIIARKMRQDNESWEPTHGALNISTNNEPLVAAGERAFWRRVGVVPFKMRWFGPGDGPAERQVSIAPIDPELTRKLRAEAPGILLWLLEGLFMYHRDGLVVPAAVQQASEDARKGASLWAAFIAEAVEPGTPSETITVKEVWATWQNYRDEYSQHRSTAPTTRKDLVTAFTAEVPSATHVKSAPGQRNVAEHFAKVKWTPLGKDMVPAAYPPMGVQVSTATPATGTTGGATVTPLYPSQNPAPGVGTSAGVI